MAKKKTRVEEALLWLAANAYIEVNVIREQAKKFVREYTRIMGRKPTRAQYNVARSTRTKGGDEFRVVIPRKNEKYREVLEQRLARML